MSFLFTLSADCFRSEVADFRTANLNDRRTASVGCFFCCRSGWASTESVHCFRSRSPFSKGESTQREQIGMDASVFVDVLAGRRFLCFVLQLDFAHPAFRPEDDWLPTADDANPRLLLFVLYDVHLICKFIACAVRTCRRLDSFSDLVTRRHRQR